MPSFPVLPESGGFLFSGFALVSQLKPFRDFYSRNRNERSALKKIRSLAFAGLFVLSAAHATTVTEIFTNNPSQDGWQIFGDTNLFEFDYFPDGDYEPSIDASMADMTVTVTNESDFYFAYDNLPLAIGVTYHVILTHAAGVPTISGAV